MNFLVYIYGMFLLGIMEIVFIIYVIKRNIYNLNKYIWNICVILLEKYLV